jgi:hypothetical protein
VHALKTVLFNDTVHWKGLEASVLGEGNVNMGLWWNDSDRGKTTAVEAKLFKCHHKSHMDWLGIEPGLLQ